MSSSDLSVGKEMDMNLTPCSDLCKGYNQSVRIGWVINNSLSPGAEKKRENAHLP